VNPAQAAGLGVGRPGKPERTATAWPGQAKPEV